MNSPHKGPVTRKMVPFGAVITRKNHHFDGIFVNGWKVVMLTILSAACDENSSNYHSLSHTARTTVLSYIGRQGDIHLKHIHVCIYTQDYVRSRHITVPYRRICTQKTSHISALTDEIRSDCSVYNRSCCENYRF